MQMRRFRMTTVICLFAVIVAGLDSGAFGTGSARAAVYQLRLTTDNDADYTDIESLAHSVADRYETPEEKCIAVWSMARRSRRQTAAMRESGRILWDPILHYNSYGALNCGIVSSLNVSCWQQLGYRTRYVELGDHTVSEVSWDEGRTWHMFDSSMSFYCYNHAGEVASCQEIMESHACELSGGKSEPGHYYLYHGAPQCMTHRGADGWRKAGDQPVGYGRTLASGASSYTDGFEGQDGANRARYGRRYALGLMPTQRYVRYWQPLESAPEFAGQFAPEDCYRPVHGIDPNQQHGLGNLRGNGRWTFEPDFADPHVGDLFYDVEGMEVRRSGEVCQLAPVAPQRGGRVTFKIAAANVITSMRIEGRLSGDRRAGDASLAVSRDAGVTWQPAWQSPGGDQRDFAFKLRDEVAAVTDCLLRFEFRGDVAAAALEKLRITTITQVNRRTLPRLTAGVNHVRLAADDQLETVQLWPRLDASEQRPSWTEENVHRVPPEKEIFYSASAGPALDNQPGAMTWRLEFPTPLKLLRVNFIPINKMANSFVAAEAALDGATFREFYRRADSDGPVDPLISQEWQSGDFAPDARAAALRFKFQAAEGAGTYMMPGLHDVLITAGHEPRSADFAPIEIAYEWIEHREEGDVRRRHVEVAESLPHAYAINVAGYRDPTMLTVSVRLRPATGGDPVGYSDGVDVGDTFERRPLAYRWGRNVTRDRPYQMNPSSDPSSGNPDAGGELTNGKIVAPTDLSADNAIQEATAFWSGGAAVTATIDLGGETTVAGALVSTHQPTEQYAHPARIEVAISDDGQSWRACGATTHAAVWSPPADYEPWEHDDDPKYAKLPAGGRLAYSFPVVFAQPARGRYLRVVCEPLPGRGMGLSELEAFDAVDVAPGG